MTVEKELHDLLASRVDTFATDTFDMLQETYSRQETVIGLTMLSSIMVLYGVHLAKRLMPDRPIDELLVAFNKAVLASCGKPS